MRKLFPGLTFASLVVISAAVAAAEQKPNAAHLEFFEKKIRPVLVEHCYSCHSAKAKTLQGGLLLDSKAGLLKGGDSGPAVVSGKPADSLLLKALRYQDGYEMPPKGKLPAGIVADFERWIRLGAPDPRTGAIASIAKKTVDYQKGLKFWAFQPPRDARPPKVQNTGWVKRELDRFILSRLEKQNLRPSEAAKRHALIRRAYFGLIGLPPTPAEVEAFVNDTSPNAFAKVVEKLLNSPHYGERWGRHWLDVARYGEDQAHTFKARRYPRGYRYRDWVVKAFNDDMPYDRFLKLQIAGDLLEGNDKHEQYAALGLFALGPVYYQDNGEKAKALADEWDDRVDTLGRGVLGLTVSCARCHDHKYDPISMKDYYGLVGIFASSEYTERPIVPEKIVAAKKQADAAVNRKQLEIDRFLAVESRNVREEVAKQIPRYVVGAWKVLQAQKKRNNDRRLFRRVAREEAVSEFLLKRWVTVLKAAPRKVKVQPWWTAWSALLKSQDSKRDLSKDAAAVAAVRKVGEQLRDAVKAQLPRRKQLFAHFGENLAFVAAQDQVKVEPGTIPLGNLFDDDRNTSLAAALASDPFKSTANQSSLGVDRVVFGWGKVAQIAPGIRFDFQHLGSDSARYGSVTNDGWHTSGGIRTQGRSVTSNAGRMEQGIGMHANALITFDLDELRKAGLMSAGQKFVFKVDRAGLNDDVFGNGTPRVHLAVIVAGEQKKNESYDAIIAGYVNGRKVSVTENDRMYYFNGEIPDPLKADGKFARFEVAIPAKARYLTLASTAAARDGEDNTISSDHAVFSGARLLLDPRPKAALAAKREDDRGEKQFGPEDRQAALLLSVMLADKGLLALPGKEAASRLKGDAKTAYGKLQQELSGLRKTAASIKVETAHSLREGNSRDMPVYLQGNPTKHGDVAPRGLLPILTRGKRLPFKPKGSGRLQLAQSVASKDNPLTARVIVNRVWRGHFGYGLVRTPSNFGSLGERPSHPLLLDYLVHRFIESGWSLKWLHREIMLSATYQQSAAMNDKNYAVDPENRLLWRMNRRRLEVEPWRDAMLAVSGRLDKTLGGPSSRLADANNRRRTLYGFISRHQLNDLLRLFDFPDPNITSDKRTVTTVPLQQLFVLNSDFMTAQAKALAARLQQDKNQTTADRIRHAYLLLYSRPATAAEVKIGASFLETVASSSDSKRDGLSPWEQYALALLGANEFTFID